MKYFIIIYIALGLVLASVIGVTYVCDSAEMFPTYYGSPFVFKKNSLGSSLTYYYSVSGVLMNVVTWSIVLLIFKKVVLYFIGKLSSFLLIRKVLNGFVTLLMLFITLIIYFELAFMGSGFEQGFNYWHFNLEQEIKERRIECKGEWSFINYN